jgi:hypothetical protein
MRKSSSILGTLTALATALAAHAQSTTLTYQGELKQAGAPANGTFDMRFQLFDAASGGTQLGTTQCVNNVPVSAGTFTASFDFGQQFASAAPRFLEIIVRADTGLPCTDATGYVILAPRQPITTTPRAMFAPVANALASPDGSPESAIFADSDGRIGIGTTTPGHSVTIANPAPTLALHDTDSNIDPVGYISYRDGNNVEQGWIGYGSAGDPDFSIINARPGGDIALRPLGGGRVGVGTSTPLATLDVRGDIRFGASGQYFPAVGDASSGIVRGTVGGAGCAGATAVVGNGFTVTHTTGEAFGDYLVTFDVPFSSPPSVVGSSYWDSFFGGKYVTITGVSTTSFRAKLFDSSGESICRDWSFIAIGLR